jgi:putative Mg2+ transporter-C (MgtC) family protein
MLFMDWLDQLQNNYELSILGRLLLASLLGGLIGLEREVHGRPAGFRTHLLVTLGSCLMMIVSEYFFIKFGDLRADGVVRLDPGRVAAQIVTGIGFLGAGAIIKEGHAVRGLTTAACLWVVAGIGMAVGVGLYSAALIVTAVALGNLLFLKRVELMLKKDRYRTLIVHCDDQNGVRQKLEAFLAERSLRVLNFGIEKDKPSKEVRFEFQVAQCGDDVRGVVAEAIADFAEVKKVRFR